MARSACASRWNRVPPERRPYMAHQQSAFSGRPSQTGTLCGDGPGPAACPAQSRLTQLRHGPVRLALPKLARSPRQCASFSRRDVARSPQMRVLLCRAAGSFGGVRRRRDFITFAGGTTVVRPRGLHTYHPPIRLSLCWGDFHGCDATRTTAGCDPPGRCW